MTHRRKSSWIAVIIFVGAASLYAQTQSGLNEQACGQFHQAEVAMQQTYAKVLKEYSADPQFIAKLEAAQKAWLAFRDAEMEAIFPKANKQAEYGTVYPMCHCVQLQHLTEERTKQLRQWLDGVPEGEVCAGSIRMSHRSVSHPETTARSVKNSPPNTSHAF